MNTDDTHLETLSEKGTPPKTRINDALHARQIWEMMWRADEDRAHKRKLVKGLVDGNPPYRQSDLRAAGRDYACNVNWRIAESYVSSATGAFYDLFNEAPTYATIKLKDAPPDLADKWSKCVTQHFDWLCRYEPRFDYDNQISHDEMVLFGRGPMVFEDIFDWRPRSVLDHQLKVPERTKSDTSFWELAGVEVDYLPDELWRYILDEEAASKAGWNVERVKQAIISASPDSTKGGLYRTWEWHQQQLKNGSIYYSMSSKTVSVAHLFYREFAKKGEAEGKISHLMVVRDSADDKPDKFLFQKIARFDNWNQCIHPMYYDRGGGGFHHSVTGMGVKMFSAMEFQNRLLCNLADKAFTPKVMFKPTTSTTNDSFSLQQFGEYAVMNEGFDMVQTPVAGVIEEGTIFNREITNLISSNLSQYRTNATEPIKGNPDTATQVKLDASKEASLQKTQMARYYAQKDALYAEMYRRAVNSPGKTFAGGARAAEFVERCKKDGIPKEALNKIEYVKASRVVGQGSEFLRQQSTEFLFGTVLPMLPEDGRTNLIDDVIASRAGYSAVNRYNPKPTPAQLPDDQYALAISQVADMKIGVPAVVTASQNPAMFATTFLQAADQAAASLEQGAKPEEVAAFLDLAGQAIAQHLQRLAQDPSRKQLVEQIEEGWKKVAQLLDQLMQHIQQQQQAQAEQQAQMQQEAAAMQSDFALQKMRQDGELELKRQKTAFGIQEKTAKTTQSMALKDATTAQQIKLQSMKQRHEMRMAQMKMEHERKMAEESAKEDSEKD